MGGKGGEGGKGGQGMTGCCGVGAALWVRVCLPAAAVEPLLILFGREYAIRIEPLRRLHPQIDPGQAGASMAPQEVL